MEKTELISHLKIDSHELIQNSRKEKEMYGPILTQIILKNT